MFKQELLHVLDELSRFGCPLDVLSPIQQAVLSSEAEDTAETALLRIDRFPRLLSWLRGLLRCDDLGQVLQLNMSDASGQALLLLLQTSLYLQKSNQHPALVQQAATAAAFAAQRLPAATARDYSSALFPPDLQLLLGPDRIEVTDKTQFFADYNANAQKELTELQQYVEKTSPECIWLNGRVEQFAQAAYRAADAAHQMLGALENCPLPADDTIEPPHLVMRGQRPIPSIAANLVPPETLQFVEAARERAEVEAAIAELVSSIGDYVGLGVEECGGKEAALGGGLAESNGAASCDGENQRRGSN